MYRSLIATLVWCSFAALSPVEGLEAAEGELTVHKRSRVESDGGWEIKEQSEPWNANQTAIIVCDMWDSHHCLNAVRRAVEMAPRMDAVLKEAREQGVLIIHAPSSCLEPYKEHPGRKTAQSAPRAANLPADIDQWCRMIPSEEKAIYPIDQTDGGEDDDAEEHKVWHEKLAALGRNPKAPWKSQLSLLTIADGDAISDSGVEIWNLLESRGIENVILLGVHTNMCVLGRPFGLRQMAKNGKNVVLMRDMTDTMYNPARWPYVSHFAGTDLIVEHIEKYVCPTITSVDLVGGEAFRFSRDKRRVLMLIGDDEYKTEKTLPAFAESELKPLGFDVTVIHSDSQDKNRFPGMAEAVPAADLVLVSVRRRMPPKEQLDALRAHVAAGKPLVGIRTASHAWSLRSVQQAEELEKQGHAAWPEFDAEVLGGNYTGHHGAGPKTTIAVAGGANDHPILRGIDLEKLSGHGSLYRTSPLSQTAAPLLTGSIEGQPSEPVAWTNLAGPKRARAFYTSLGHEVDFANPAFRKLLVNGFFWALENPYPRGQDVDKLLPEAAR
jgi:nicotinamidase-related amidase/type 1 glutamine amidotransferase